jgi:hypothetical protein
MAGLSLLNISKSLTSSSLLSLYSLPLSCLYLSSLSTLSSLISEACGLPLAAAAAAEAGHDDFSFSSYFLEMEMHVGLYGLYLS